MFAPPGLRFHAQTAGVSLTAQQPKNNIARVAIQALAAVLGGTQSLHTDGFDEALALPTEDAARIALRTQQILAFESGVANTVDPLGGSYFVERVTLDMEQGAFDYFDKLDAMGGMVRAIERGFPQKEIADASYAYQRAVETREKIIVGVNEYLSRTRSRRRFCALENRCGSGRRQNCSGCAPGAPARRSKRAWARSSKRWHARLRRARAALSSGNTMPFLLDCVRAYATWAKSATPCAQCWAPTPKSASPKFPLVSSDSGHANSAISPSFARTANRKAISGNPTHQESLWNTSTSVPPGTKGLPDLPGCMTYGSKQWREWVLEEEESLPLLPARAGGRHQFFDTADMYSAA